MELNRLTSLLNRDFLREFIRISVPIMLANLMMSSLHIVDNIMVGSLGDLELASVAQANQLTFVFRLTLFGVSGGCAAFAAQYWGNGDVEGVRRTLGISLAAALCFSLIFALAAVAAPGAVLVIYTPDAAAIEVGGSYLRVVGPSYIVLGVCAVFNAVNRSTERVKINLVAAGLAILVNAFLNWCFIFGNLGFKRMEVEGAALASAIAAVVEFVVLIGWTYKKKYPAAATLKEMFTPGAAYVKHFFRIAAPITLNECIWGFGMSAYAAIYGRISIQAVAAMSVFNTVDQVMLSALRGITAAAGVMVGIRIGAGRKKEAASCGHIMLGASAIASIVLGAALFASRGVIVSFFNISPEAKALAEGVLAIASMTLWVRSMTGVLIVGVLRAGGDALYSLFLDGGGIWLIGVPLAIICAFLLGLPLQYTYLIIHAEELFKLVLGYRRFRSNKWINTLSASVD